MQYHMELDVVENLRRRKKKRSVKPTCDVCGKLFRSPKSFERHNCISSGVNNIPTYSYTAQDGFHTGDGGGVSQVEAST